MQRKNKKKFEHKMTTHKLQNFLHEKKSVDELEMMLEKDINVTQLDLSQLSYLLSRILPMSQSKRHDLSPKQWLDIESRLDVLLRPLDPSLIDDQKII